VQIYGEATPFGRPFHIAPDKGVDGAEKAPINIIRIIITDVL